jgi:hypothetical protein
MSKIFETARSAVKAHFVALMDEETRKCVQLAHTDLYYGPVNAEYCESEGLPVLSFTEACEQIHNWWRDHDHEVWYDVQLGEVLTKCPEGYTDEETDEFVDVCWEDYVLFNGCDLKRAVFGELEPYLRNYI